MGQAADGVRPPATTVFGQVVDTITGAPLAGAEVIVIQDGTNAVVGSATSNAQGRTSLVISPSAGRYSILVRKVGYVGLRKTDVRFPGNDTIALRFMLHPFVSSLNDLVAQSYYDCDARFSPCNAGQGDPSFWKRIEGQRSFPQISQARSRDLAKEIQKAARRVERANRAGRPLDPNDVLFVRDAAQVCANEVSIEEEFSVFCREVVKRTPRTTLERLAQELTKMEASAQRKTMQAPSRE